MQYSEVNLAQLSDDQITHLLYDYRDDGQNGDVILVVGSRKTLIYRMPLAVELYRSGRAPQMLLSGGVQWPDWTDTEAHRMRQYALDHGVPAVAITVENGSQTTIENAQFTAQMLTKTGMPQRILVVTNSFHMFRLVSLLRTYLPASVKLTYCAADDTNTREGNWFKTDVGRARVAHELTSVQAGIADGIIRDFEVQLSDK
jgi:uncharacterized SAM-binding protein YcdF (DUF218 family)